MNVFPGWRAVGQAMRWARHHKQDLPGRVHITSHRRVIKPPSFLGGDSYRDLRWHIHTPIAGRELKRRATIAVEPYGRDLSEVTVAYDGVLVHVRPVDEQPVDGARVLRLIAALHLIPFVFADAADGDPYATAGARVLAAFPHEEHP